MCNLPVQMFTIFIFCLVNPSDPFPTLPSTVISAQSHIAPSQQTSATLTPTNSTNSSGKRLYESSQKSTASSVRSLTMNRTNADSSTVSLSPRKVKETDSQETNNGNERESADRKDYRAMNYMSSWALAPADVLGNRHQDTETLPKVLKLNREYSPSEIAEYILNTGDEKGFAQGIAEMVEDGQIMESRDDVIAFLEAVQKEVAKLRRHRDGNDN